MVLDDYQEGIPVAWALPNREDKFVVIKILQAIKEVCGSLKPSWFMSDMAPVLQWMERAVWTKHNQTRKYFDRKPHPLIMMSLLSLPEGVTTKNNYSTKYSQA